MKYLTFANIMLKIRFFFLGKYYIQYLSFILVKGFSFTSFIM